MKVYRGTRQPDFKTIVTINDQPFNPQPSQNIWNHSPDGFNWGYGGSGPSQLALAILLDHFGDTDLARKYYQDFKWNVISKLPDTWELTDQQVEQAVYEITMTPAKDMISTEIRREKK